MRSIARRPIIDFLLRLLLFRGGGGGGGRGGGRGEDVAGEDGDGGLGQVDAVSIQNRDAENDVVLREEGRRKVI